MRVSLYAHGPRTKTEQKARDNEVFRVLRLIKGRTNAAIARESGVSAATIGKLCWRTQDGGTRWPRHTTLSRIAEAMGYRYTLEPMDRLHPAIEDHPEAETRRRDLTVSKRSYRRTDARAKKKHVL